MQSRKSLYFDLEMRPNRSLPRRTFWWLVGGVAGVFLLMGLRLMILGAWLVLPFMLIDIALLWWAMRASYRSGEMVERLSLDKDGLSFVRIDPSGRRKAARLDAARARVELEEMVMKQNRLWLRAGDRRLSIGAFLSPPERVEIKQVIEDGLRQWRRG
ncbi:MAG: DUF2244 domain-containing protein [Sphingomonadaceae bacterium]